MHYLNKTLIFILFCRIDKGLLNEYLSEADTAGDVAETDSSIVVGESPSQDEDAVVEDRGNGVLQNCFATILDSLTVNNSQ